MKQILILALLFASAAALADDAKNEWHNTTLSEATIKKIQDVKYQYNKCIVDEMKTTAYKDQDIRNATDAIIKKCEDFLGAVRKVYLDEKVPEIIADRHLKQMRMQTTRNVLKQMMFADAVRKSGQSSQ